MRVDHIGYAVKDIEAALKKFALLGYRPCGELTHDEGRGVSIRFMEDPAGVRVELISPLGEGSPVSGWLAKNGNSPYHICCESGDMERDIGALKGNGFMVVQAPSSAPAMGGRRVAFLYSVETGLLELVEGEGSRLIERDDFAS